MSIERVDVILARLFPELSRSKIQSLLKKNKIVLKRSFANAQDDWPDAQDDNANHSEHRASHPEPQAKDLKSGQKLNSQGLGREDFEILADDELKYVSRGALKLKGAVENFGVKVDNSICLDVGLSTGGFSDFLLQSGAQKVLGIDVGREQLHESLRDNPKLIWADKINAREPIPEEILSRVFQSDSQLFDWIVIDVSFISLSLIVPNIKSYLKPNGGIIALVKPQFEVTKAQLNKKGVVTDPEVHSSVMEKIHGVFKENQLIIEDSCPSPIEGDHGNKEFLILAKHLTNN